MALPSLCRLKTLWTLGPTNLARVGFYRLGIKTGLHPVLKLKAAIPVAPFFLNHAPAPTGAIATTAWRDTTHYFSHHMFPLNGIPDWHANPFKPGARVPADVPWHQLPDFNPALGDIKTIWEASRFDWVVAMAERGALGDDAELARLNEWLADWSRANPPYMGVNWKCGQEASIRVMHLATAAIILGQVEACPDSLRDLIMLHLRRIAPTLSYAIGQSNNHGTSEAAALFIGGSWVGGAQGNAWAKAGRRWLENRAQTLIAADGTFSQYSVIYHRLMLDTYCLAEVWRRQRGLPAFSNALMERLTAATYWLYDLMDKTTGDAPNLGANDGAYLLPLTDAPYRDFRPTLQLSANLFVGARAVAENGVWDQPALWLGIAAATNIMAVPQSRTLNDGGFHVLRRNHAMALLRYPRFRFRPSQCDMLHLDLWVDGVNLLRDGGSYSYASEEHGYFSGVSSHNTVQFDGRDPMPRLGKFLFGAWPKAQDGEVVKQVAESTEAAAGYTDDKGATHQRHVTLRDRSLRCEDTLSGHATCAVLRWRLAPDNWQISGDSVSNGTVSLRVNANTPLTLRLVQGQESRHYLETSPLPVLEVETSVPSTIQTVITF